MICPHSLRENVAFDSHIIDFRENFQEKRVFLIHLGKQMQPFCWLWGSNWMQRQMDFRQQRWRHRVGASEAPPPPPPHTVYGSCRVTEAAGPALLQRARTGEHARMASPGMGAHPIRKRGAGRSAAVERRNLLTVCRWEQDCGRRGGGGASGLQWCWSVYVFNNAQTFVGKKKNKKNIWTWSRDVNVSVFMWYLSTPFISHQHHLHPPSLLLLPPSHHY